MFPDTRILRVTKIILKTILQMIIVINKKKIEIEYSDNNGWILTIFNHGYAKCRIIIH